MCAAGGSPNNPDWFVFWSGEAARADLVVFFDADSDGYYGSDACHKEKNWTTNHKTGGYMSVGKMMDDGLSAKQIAQKIAQKV